MPAAVVRSGSSATPSTGKSLSTSTKAEAVKAQSEILARNSARDSGTFVDGDSGSEDGNDEDHGSAIMQAKREGQMRDGRTSRGNAAESGSQGTSRNPAKRQRTINDNQARRDEGLEREQEYEEYEEPEEDGEEPEGAEAEIEVERAVAERDAHDAYIPGSIVRVELHNFVTYDHVIFHPGPYLNMIIGPNGTGKSTIACAIALGLGYKPALLGRANDVASFVKQTKGIGWIELELKGHPAQPNLVVRRNLKEKQNTSNFLINGVKRSSKEVTEKVREYNIQIDNLCSFLPQDKVTEFARMTPKELLVETIKAAADGATLLKHYHRLLDYSKMLRVINSELRTSREECEQLQQQNQRLQRDADRHAERQQMAERVEILEVALKMAELMKAHHMARKLIERKRVFRMRFVEFTARMKPLTERLEEVQEMESKLKATNKVQTDHQEKTQRAVRKLEGELKKLAMFKQKTELELDGLANNERGRAKQVETLKEAIAELEERVAAGAPTVETSNVDKRLGDIRRQQVGLMRRVQDSNEEASRIQEQASTNKRQVERVSTQLRNLNSVKNVRFEALRSSDAGCAKAVEWLRENKQMFTGRVYEPALLELEVVPEHKNLTHAVERLISWKQLKTFVCELRADYDLLNQKLNDELKLHVNIEDIEGMHEVEQFQPPMSRQDVRKLGFVDYAIHLVNGPNAIRDFLCFKAGLHKIPVAVDSCAVNVARIEASRKFNRYIVGDVSYSITYSQYNNSASSESQLIKNARNLVHSIDRKKVEQLDREMKELHEQMTTLQASMAKIETEKAKVSAESTQLDEEKNDLISRKKEVERALRAYNEDKVNLNAKQENLKRLLEKPSVEGQRKRLKAKLADAAIRLTTLAQDLKSHRLTELHQLHESNLLRLATIQTIANLNKVKEVISIANGEGDQMREDAQTLSLDLKRAKKRVMRLHAESHQALQECPLHITQKLQEMQEGGLPSRDEMLTEQAELRANLDGAPQISDDIVRRYEEKKAKIEELERIIEEKENTQAQLTAKVAKYRAKWEPPLRRLINKVNEKFSDAFERFNCGGEVALSQGNATGEDADLAFEEWCVEIRVKFREKEELQLLTGERQSGGERSLSTIMYLMSLTELGSSPFSLVDEINQGMDQRAERLVHDQMVLTTCRAKASQYFLITPKLLTGLKYHPLMRVLIINNGDYLPSKFSMRDYIQPKSNTITARA
ncbi:P-loop containing nucleoside triphosphate hydrolase protein [Tilletiaria anomala UBC 951]|uniref:Structural maintenance of chromosomes protein 5 n=1 Tax=Tilletiaria anomala (strain ATCC 24038 / CBS 436.72 / UBC 951) TaxID=1037660 RepID=A0A066VQB8_TILAU|nr:P-loop containing nucleoside triphosphate hydrolase protein [Tilletiaria anomala UBC 951]KDN43917.1 P-loop containing nucleoside triphosphate hydrolase protein [Tilletiaria anomala UBC 951]